MPLIAHSLGVMDLNDVYTLLNFYINKSQGGWYSPEELTMIVDRAQRTLFNTYYTKYQTSQRLDDALAPFKLLLSFSNALGVISVPGDYYDMLSITTTVTDADDITTMRPVEVVTDDELAYRTLSQIDPPSLFSPVAVRITNHGWQLYPKVQHFGNIIYLKQPRSPVFAYSLVSGRVIVYDPLLSTQLEWNDKDILSIILIALNGLGINLSEADILQWSEMKTQQNLTGVPKA
jgi:hypothetical protein